MKKTPNYQSKTFKLYYKRTLIGTITNVSTNQPFFMGDLEVTEAYERFRDSFARRATEEAGADRFDPLIDVDHWKIADDEGMRDDAYVTIEDDGKSITWRW